MRLREVFNTQVPVLRRLRRYFHSSYPVQTCIVQPSVQQEPVGSCGGAQLPAGHGTAADCTKGDVTAADCTAGDGTAADGTAADCTAGVL